MKYPDLFTRLVAQTVEPENDRSCWLASGKMDKSGYVFITKRVPEKPFPVNRRGHREIEEITRGRYNEFDLDDDPLGPILLVERPSLDRDDQTINHHCYVRRCWNPDHFSLMTRVENTQERNDRAKAKS